MKKRINFNKNFVKIFLLVIMVSQLLVLAFSGVNFDLIGVTNNKSSLSTENKVYSISLPISINGNTNFTQTATNKPWPGAGTASSPILISGLTISNATGYDFEIQNTNLYFELTNFNFSLGIGLYLKNVTNAQITNGIVYNSSVNGILIESSSNINVTQTKLYYNSNDGIHLLDSSEITLNTNTIYSNLNDGIANVGQGNNLIEGNIVYNNLGNGLDVYLDSSGLVYSNVTALNNNIHNNHLDGILYSSVDNSMLNGNNIANNGEFGIDREFCYNISLINTVLVNNGYYFYIGGYSGITYPSWFYRFYLFSNNTINNKPFIYNESVSNLKLSGAGEIILYNVTNSLIENNNLNNGGVGLYTYESKNITITNNTILNNYDNGITLDLTTNSTVSNNLIQGNNNGLVLNDTQNAHIINNTISYNRIYGIYESYISNGVVIDRNTIQSNSLGGSYAGILLLASNSNNVTNNEIYDNKNMAVALDGLSNSLIGNNSIYNNIGDAIDLSTTSGSNTNDLFINNRMIGNTGTGINFSFAYNNTVIGNNFTQNNGAGLFNIASINNLYINNTLDNNGNGAAFYSGSSYNNFTNNIVYNCNDGLDIETNSNNNTITNNTLTLNADSISAYGAYIVSSQYNVFENNDFIDNYYTKSGIGYQIYDDTGKNTFLHNYYSDWTTPDQNGDGIVDKPYNFSTYTYSTTVYNKDPLPSVNPLNPQHYFGSQVQIISLQSNEVVNIPLTIKWSEENYWDLNTTYSLYYSTDGGSSWTLIVLGLTSKSYTWNNANLDFTKTYTLKLTSTDSKGTLESAFVNSLTLKKATTSSPITTPSGNPSPSTNSTSNKNPSSNTPTSTSPTSPGFELFPFLVIFISLSLILLRRRKT